MNWKMTRAVSFDVVVNQDAGVDYSIRIYDENPLTENTTARLLAEGTANNNMPFSSVMDCPIDVTDVYVCLTDALNRSVVKLCSIENGSFKTSFGTLSTRAATRAVNNSITTYTPNRTEAEIRSLSEKAKELKDGIVIVKGDVYKIAKGTTYHGKITTWGISDGIATVIIEGTWDPKSNITQIETGIDLIVTGTGKIVLPKDGSRYNKPLNLVGSSRLTIFQGGSITGETPGTGYIYLPNASGSRLNYNAGTIQVHTIQVDGDGVFYNNGKVEANMLELNNSTKFINQGEAHFSYVSHVNGTIENGCRLIVDRECYGTLIMGDNCAATIGNYGSDANWGKSITIGSNSMLTINGTVHWGGITVSGPQNGYALIKIGTLTRLNGFKHSGGNVYYEVQNVQISNTWERDSYLPYLLRNTSGMLSKWGESPLYIPAGECTGEGNRPDLGTGTSATGESVTYTYAFEDNFPLVGDYDFNDIVLDVQTMYKREKNTNAIKSIQLNVTLAATGAGRTLGAGLRIVGIPKSAIQSISGGRDVNRFIETLTSPRTGKGFFSYNPTTRLEDGDNSIVIPLFNDAHQLFEVEQGTHVNTASTSALNANGKELRTYEIIINLTDQTQKTPLFSKDNLDFFICYQYQQMQKRMEVHLYEFRPYGSTSAGMTMETNLDLAGNNTWAICVPNFRYPKEFVNISISSDISAGAYPLFLDWARNRNNATTWHTKPNENNVYR